MNFPNFLKIAVVPSSGLFKVVVTEKNETKIVGGSEKSFLELLSEVLKFKYEIKVPHDGEWGTYENEQWTGVIGKVYYGEADIGIGKISITEQRMKVVDYSYPYDVEDLTFATDIPKYLPKTTAFIAPFDTYIWSTLLITTIVFLIAFRFCQKKKRSFQRIVLKFVGYLLLQPLDVEPASKRSRLLVVTWLLTARFLTFFYSAALLAFLTIPQEENSVRTIPQLSEAITNGKIQSMSIKGASYTETLLKNEQEIIKVIVNHIKRNNFLIEPRKDVVIDSMSDGKTAVIASRYFFSRLHDIFVSDDSFFSLTRAVVVKKGFCCKQNLDRMILRISGSGIYTKLQNDELFQMKLAEKVYESAVTENLYSKLSLEDLLGAFIFLLTGYCVSILVCILEILQIFE